MTRLEITYCGHVDKDVFSDALEIADSCETEDEFYAEVDRRFACEEPFASGYACKKCYACATREEMYGLCVREIE